MVQVTQSATLTPFMDGGLAALRLKLKREKQRLKRKANRKKYKATADYDHRATKLHVGEIVMVKTLASLAPYNYRGQTVYGIPYGTTMPAIRTMKGVQLLTMTGVKVNALRAKNEYKELPFVAVPLDRVYKAKGLVLPTRVEAEKALAELRKRENVVE